MNSSYWPAERRDGPAEDHEDRPEAEKEWEPVTKTTENQHSGRHQAFPSGPRANRERVLKAPQQERKENQEPKFRAQQTQRGDDSNRKSRPDRRWQGAFQPFR